MSGVDRTAELEQLIAEFEKSGLRELHVVRDGVEIYLSNDGNSIGLSTGAAPVVPAVSPTPLSPAAAGTASPLPAAAPLVPAETWPEGAEIIRAPYLGTFYRAPKPGSPAYVEVGSAVTAESELCLVEVMKLFTTVRAGSDGIVHAILSPDGALVEADQPLFVIVKG
ncbi:biotin/lipoyl-containing protein [Sphingopyxis sp. KK2]|uniref:acetyl-CoA carboxylase biotin carboxyl carrier protein n=1 Tax=Sphingopyxis sp. KK2 TaxID=1855727 RepID=UPI00097E6F9E|nr:biotin/lipoyl-containing protein [Sphingopyxis sp. KK2]